MFENSHKKFAKFGNFAILNLLINSNRKDSGAIL